MQDSMAAFASSASPRQVSGCACSQEPDPEPDTSSLQCSWAAGHQSSAQGSIHQKLSECSENGWMQGFSYHVAKLYTIHLFDKMERLRLTD